MTISMKEQDQMPGEMGFPEAKLRALEEKISHPRWVVPVLPEQELEALLVACTELAAKGEDVNHPACQRFYNDALTLSFTKILTDDAVSSWKGNIQQCVRSNCEKLVKLCALKLDDPRLLNLLSMALNPSNKFHMFNASRVCEGLSISANNSSTGQGSVQEIEVFAKSHDHRSPRGWLVHLINIFGQAGGFVRMRERFEVLMGYQKPDLTASMNSIEKVATETTEKEAEENKPDQIETIESTTVIADSPDSTPPRNEPSSMEQSMTGESRVAAVWQLLRPLGLCHDLLTAHAVTTYLLPVLECIPTLLESLTDEELKREARGSENKTDTVSCLIRACKYVSIKTPHHQNLLKSLEMFRLKMILRLLQMSSFNGKMSALNEINQLIATFTQQPKPEWLTPAVITNWIRDNNVVDIVLRDSLHQPQYVERLEKMLRFMIKENSLTLDDLDAIWKAQHGKHEAIVKNIHDLLAKLAWDFTPDQLDHLFDCFKASWSTCNKKQSDKLLEVIRRLAEDDKDGVMANKVLVLFWNLAHSDEACTEIIDMALANLIKILDYSCSQDRDTQKTLWLDKCVEELKTREKWVLPALKVMREICCLHESAGGTGVRPHVTRQELIDRLQTQHSLVILVTNSLTSYMDGVRNKLAAEGTIDWDNWLPDGRYPHAAQVHERLSFLRFLLKDGQLWLCSEQAKQIWVCLAEKPAHLFDREACFRWFSKLMGEEPDLDPNVNLHFFRRNIMTLPPNLLTHAGIKCFERFFKAVNTKEGKLKMKRRSFQLFDADLIGLDYLWRVITECDDEISLRGIELLREVCTCVGPQLAASLHHESFLTHCFARLQRLQKEMEQQENGFEGCTRMCRVIRAIQEYINECDRRFSSERQILPIYRSARGRHCSVIVRFNFQTGQRQVEDIEVFSHSNETLHSLRSNIQRRLKALTENSLKLEMYINKIELYANGELLDSSHDRKILSQIPLRDKTVIIAKVYDGQVCGSGGCGSSNESSSDSSTSSPPLSPTPEHALPGVLFSQGSWYLPCVLSLEHIGITKRFGPLTEAAHLLSQICPPHKQTTEKLTEALLSREDTKLRDMLYGPEPPTVAYNMEVLYSMVMPASDSKLDRSRSFQLACVKKAPLLVKCLSDKEFLQDAAPHTRRVAFLALVRLNKLILYTLGHLFEIIAPHVDESNVDREIRMDVTILREALQTVPNHSCELLVKAISEKLATSLGEQVIASGRDEGDSASSLLWWRVPTTTTVRALYSLAFAVAQSAELNGMIHPDDVVLVRESMEVVTICTALSGGRLETLLHETWWQDTALYLMIDCSNAQIRIACAEQVLAMCAWGGGGGARAALVALGEAGAVAGAAGGPGCSVPTCVAGGPSCNVPTCAAGGPSCNVPTCAAGGPGCSVPTCAAGGPSCNVPTCAAGGPSCNVPTCAAGGPGCSVPTCAAGGPSCNMPTCAAGGPSCNVPTCAVGGPSCNMPTCAPGSSGCSVPACAVGGSGCNVPAGAAGGPGCSMPAGAGALAAGGARLQRHARNAQQFLQLLCRLVSLAGPNSRTLSDLALEVAWIRSVRDNPETLDDTLLEGHLNLAKELMSHVPAQIKYQYGSHPDHKDSGLIKEILTEFLWPYSWAWSRSLVGGGGFAPEPTVLSFRSPAGGGGAALEQPSTRSPEETALEPPPPLCRTSGAAAAAADLLLALVHGCVPNMAALVYLIEQMFYSDKGVCLSEWEYMPCVGPRPPAGLVGLKNAGATCYMNSVLQQMYCVPSIRNALLTVQGAATDPDEDFSGDSHHHHGMENNIENNSEYNITILKQVQAIFAHLHYSKLQYYIPRGLWAHFKLQGEPVNLREQQDAVEFFMSLVESLDEALKSLGQDQLMAKTMGGTYSDQKICKGCPHRYCKEEPFSVVSLDIRNLSRLQESLEAYVRGELLEGPDAYHCDKCNKKVVTVKRLCLNKLPPVLVIQLKRFEYDFEKVCAIKFNDYFEFPRELDVEPYTAWGLARAEGDASLWEGGDEGSRETHYQLSGIVVHSGQASGGHYYSYVLLRDNGSETGRWVKLDDGDVSECAMHDDEEMKVQCFGGEYMGELFDPMLKRVTYKRQKRWWNAYMLFYTRKDTLDTTDGIEQSLKFMSLKENAIPKPIWNSVRRGNIAFSHNQDQFSLEHFNFMKKLCCMRLHVLPGSQGALWGPENEEISMLTVQLATKFLFQVGFRTKKALRGPAIDWHEILAQHLRCSQSVRAWFATDLFKNIHRLCDYLLSCPTTEVRIVFMKTIVFLAHFSIQDPPVSCGFGSWCGRDEAQSLSDQVMCSVRALAAPPHADSHVHRHLPLLFNLFHTYASLGLAEKHQLLRLKILEILLAICMDDTSASLGKYQYPESAKVHQVICVLVRCCDVSGRCAAAGGEGGAPAPNPHAEPAPVHHSAAAAHRPQLSTPAADVLYNRAGTYMKKLTEECCGCEEAIRLLQFLCWENAGWSRVALAELLWQMAYAYCHELRRHADALTAILLLEDSWQHHRIHNVIKGVSEDRPGLLETAARARSHYQKRAYACVKLIVGVMSRAPTAVRAVHTQHDARRRWRQLLAWLQDELDRYGPSGYGSYGTWSPPGTSNETSSGYFLERSNSARKTLEKAYQLCPEDDEDEEEEEEARSGEAGSGSAADESGSEEAAGAPDPRAGP